jgi:hypothetical protein
MNSVFYFEIICISIIYYYNISEIIQSVAYDN